MSSGAIAKPIQSGTAPSNPAVAPGGKGTAPTSTDNSGTSPAMGGGKGMPQSMQTGMPPQGGYGQMPQSMSSPLPPASLAFDMYMPPQGGYGQPPQTSPMPPQGGFGPTAQQQIGMMPPQGQPQMPGGKGGASAPGGKGQPPQGQVPGGKGQPPQGQTPGGKGAGHPQMPGSKGAGHPMPGGKGQPTGQPMQTPGGKGAGQPMMQQHMPGGKGGAQMPQGQPQQPFHNATSNDYNVQNAARSNTPYAPPGTNGSPSAFGMSPGNAGFGFGNGAARVPDTAHLTAGQFNPNVNPMQQRQPQPTAQPMTGLPMYQPNNSQR